MDRPVMNPSLLLEMEAPPPERRRLLGWVRAALGVFGRTLAFEPFGFLRRGRAERAETPLLRRLGLALLYRLLAVPFVVAAVAAVMVYKGTHPPIDGPSIDPQSLGIYHDPVSFLGADGTRLEGWLVPYVDAKMVIAE